MWTKEIHASHRRQWLRYPSDLINEEWAVLEPLISRAKRGGNKRSVDERRLINGLLFILSTGCQWRVIPKDSPLRNTLLGYVPRGRTGVQTCDLNNGRFLAHRNPNKSEDEPEILCHTPQAPGKMLLRDIRRATRKHHSAEDKIRISLEGLRGEESIASPCRREAIAECLYYAWLKGFLEPGETPPGRGYSPRGDKS